MIWYFLAGMIGGAAGVVLLLKWWIVTHMVRITKEDMKKELERCDDDEEDRL